jgi:hypothetical protein
MAQKIIKPDSTLKNAILEIINKKIAIHSKTTPKTKAGKVIRSIEKIYLFASPIFKFIKFKKNG